MAVRKAKSAVKSVKKKAKLGKKAKRPTSIVRKSSAARAILPTHERCLAIAQVAQLMFTQLTSWTENDLNDFDLTADPPANYPLFLKLHRLVDLSLDTPANEDTYYSNAKELVDALSPNFDLTLKEFRALQHLLKPTPLKALAPYWFTNKSMAIW